MRKIGIIAEYNPFHNGHIYHIQKIKELYPDSLLILVLNGYFLERGEISVLSKENKTKLALKNDIDIVLELPVIYGKQSSDTFAEDSINILQNFQIVLIAKLMFDIIIKINCYIISKRRSRYARIKRFKSKNKLYTN